MFYPCIFITLEMKFYQSYSYCSSHHFIRKKVVVRCQKAQLCFYFVENSHVGSIPGSGNSSYLVLAAPGPPQEDPGPPASGSGTGCLHRLASSRGNPPPAPARPLHTRKHRWTTREEDRGRCVPSLSRSLIHTLFCCGNQCGRGDRSYIERDW